MFSMLLKLLFMWFCLIIASSNESPSNEECYLVNKRSTFSFEIWKLVWQDNFQSEDYFKQNWAIDHGNCDEWDNFRDSQLSCNVKDNVKLQDGFLVMSAKGEMYDSKNYTGARLTTNRVFGHGRYEARAALSGDVDVWSYFYTHIEAVNRDIDSGIFIMLEFEKLLKSWHAPVIFNRMNPLVRKIDFNFDSSSFHLYGMEWSNNYFQFFIDDHYSVPIWYSDIQNIKPEQHIRLLQGVRTFHIDHPVPEKVNWKCPLSIVDYVRVYEKVEIDEIVDWKAVKLCTEQNDVDQSSEKQMELVDSFCASKTSQMTKSFLEYFITF